MTAKHRKAKSNHKHEDNFFRSEVMESEVRPGGNNHYTPLVGLFLLIAIGGATGAWFCFQQHQTLTYLTDNIVGMQMKIAKLQSSHEEVRQSSSKQYISESLESRLNALEESHVLAQKQVSMALATAEQLKTSDLPAQVLSLHTEMKARLEEMQQATVSLEQLNQLQSQLKGKTEEFEGVRIQVEHLATLSAELSQKVDVLTGNLGEAESKLEEGIVRVAALSTSLGAQAAEVLEMKEQLDTYQAQLEASTLEMAAVRELLEREQSKRLHDASVEEQISTVTHTLQDQHAAANSLHSELRAQLESMKKQVTQLMGEKQPPGETVAETDEETAPPAQEEATVAFESEEEKPPATDVEKEEFNPEEEADEQGEAAAQHEAPVEKEEDTVTEESATAEELEAVKQDQAEPDELFASSEEEELDMMQSEEEVPEEENQKADKEEASEGEQADEKSPVEENHKAEEEEVSEREEGNYKAEEMTSEDWTGLEESLLVNDELSVQEEIAEGQEEEEESENNSLPKNKCK